MLLGFCIGYNVAKDLDLSKRKKKVINLSLNVLNSMLEIGMHPWYPTPSNVSPGPWIIRLLFWIENYRLFYACRIVVTPSCSCSEFDILFIGVILYGL